MERLLIEKESKKSNLKLTKFYSEGELSSIQISSTDEVLSAVNHFFFDEQLTEEQLILEIYSKNRGRISDVDELRLDFDRIYTRKQIQKKAFLSGSIFEDSAEYGKEFSISTILGIKNEQRYLSANFHGFYILKPRNRWFQKPSEPLLFASLKNDNFYCLNQPVKSAEPSSKSGFKGWLKNLISFKMFSKS